MSTAKIYRVTCTGAFQMAENGSRFSLMPWGKNTTFYEGFDDGGRDYLLPDGYRLDLVGFESPVICRGDEPCAIFVHSSGRPQLVSAAYEMPVLREV